MAWYLCCFGPVLPVCHALIRHGAGRLPERYTIRAGGMKFNRRKGNESDNMVLKVYNTLNREVEEFKPLNEGKVGMYVCGPTTYDLSHMGHARAYVAFDVIRRYLEYKGYEVTYVQNFTDVDDKIIKRSRRKGMPPLELAHMYVDEYFKDMDMLGVKRATHHPYASRTIDEMTEFISGLEEKGYAYNVDGNVYFSIEKAADKVGQLTNQSLDDMLDGARVAVNPEKRHPKDFALWKRAKEGEISWESPWGPGRPGWHIECSTMSMKHIGDTLDIHGGGQDLIFPHHESEILQSESYTGKKFVRYWLHNGFVTINREKMSKSLGNFFTIREVLKKYSPATVRFFLVHTHYRRPIDYSDEHLREAKRTLNRLRHTITSVSRYLEGYGEDLEVDEGGQDEGKDQDEGKGKDEKGGEEGNLPLQKEGRKAKEDFIAAMDEDLNTREAIAALFDLVHSLNRAVDGGADKGAVKGAYAIFEEMLGVLGLPPDMIQTSKPLYAPEGDPERENELVELLIRVRESLRREKNWDLADDIRDRLGEMGISLEDTEDGTIFKRDV